jgi:hypothetical protein
MHDLIQMRIKSISKTYKCDITCVKNDVQLHDLINITQDATVSEIVRASRKWSAASLSSILGDGLCFLKLTLESERSDSICVSAVGQIMAGGSKHRGDREESGGAGAPCKSHKK